MGHETAHGFFILAVKLFYSRLGGVFGGRIGFCGVRHGGGENIGRRDIGRERAAHVLLFILSNC